MPDMSRGWIHSPAYDLALFTVSPLAGLLLVLLVLHSPAGALALLAGTYLVAIPHYLSTFSFWMGDENRAEYLGRRVAFVGVPVALVAGAGLMRLFGGPWLAALLTLIFLWNTYHVSMQSSGILSIYRHAGGGPPDERAVAQTALLALNFAVSLYYVERFEAMRGLFASFWPGFPAGLRPLTLALAAVALARFAASLVDRARKGSAPGVAEGLFLVSSLVLFHPYLWVRDYELATAGMLMGHFLQYLALVWLLHRRKYAGAAGGSRAQHLLAQATRRVPLLLGALAAAGLVVYLFGRTMRAADAFGVYVWLWNGLALVHFYMDGLIWSFKRPFVRQSLGPYLLPAR
jgi:hypothetical protein